MSEREHPPKSEWGPGPWQDEPDEKYWTDAVTRLDCCILRAQVTGSLCGYVGVDQSHPAFELSYRGLPSEEDKVRHEAFRERLRIWGRGRDRDLDSFPPDQMPPEVPVSGIGDKLWGAGVHGGLTYAGRIGFGSRPNANLWWFGFDCAHAGDICPAMDALMRSISSPSEIAERRRIFRHDRYRTISYVMTECARLAAQLKAMDTVSLDGLIPEKAKKNIDE